MPYVGQKPADIISTAVDTVTGKFSGEVDAASLDISGNIDVDGTTNLDVVDIDGAVDMASTLTVNGVTTLNEKFVIDGSANDLMKFRTTGDTASQVLGLQFQNNSEAVTAQIFGTGDNSSSGVFRIKGIGDVAIVGGDIGVTGAAGDLVVKSGGDVHVGTGDLVFATSGKGIVLGATSNTAANTLEDYEEGTFTATLAGATSNPNTAVTDTNAYYTKIGRQVTVHINFINKDTTGAAGVVTVTGLPFASLNSSGDAYVGGNVAWYLRFGINDGTDTVALSIGSNDTTIAFQVSDKNAVWTEMFHTAGSGAYLRCSTTYITAA